MTNNIQNIVIEKQTFSQLTTLTEKIKWISKYFYKTQFVNKYKQQFSCEIGDQKFLFSEFYRQHHIGYGTSHDFILQPLSTESISDLAEFGYREINSTRLPDNSDFDLNKICAHPPSKIIYKIDRRDIKSVDISGDSIIITAFSNGPQHHHSSDYKYNTKLLSREAKLITIIIKPIQKTDYILPSELKTLFAEYKNLCERVRQHRNNS